MNNISYILLQTPGSITLLLDGDPEATPCTLTSTLTSTDEGGEQGNDPNEVKKADNTEGYFDEKERKEEEKKKSPIPPIKEKNKEKIEKATNQRACEKNGKKSDLQNVLAAAQKAFYTQLIPYVSTYGRQMVREFYDYWSEPNRSGTRMRCQLQPTWNLSMRLAHWARNDRDRLLRTREDQRRQELEQRAARAAEERERNHEALMKRYDESRRQAVTYEEYQRLRRQGLIPGIDPDPPEAAEPPGKR